MLDVVELLGLLVDTVREDGFTILLMVSYSFSSAFSLFSMFNIYIYPF